MAIKTVAHIISWFLTLVSVIAMIAECSKDKVVTRSAEFAEEQNLIRQKRADIFRYPADSPDSLQWMQFRARSFTKSLDSCIKYYRDHYKVNERKYGNYLEWLYEYKKLSYLDQEWINYNKKITAKDRETQAFRDKWKEFRNKTIALNSQVGGTRKDVEAFQELIHESIRKRRDSLK